MDKVAVAIVENSPVEGSAWTEFRKELPFACQAEPAEDLGHEGVLLTNLDSCPLLIVELKGKERLPEVSTKQGNKTLAIDNFTSPTKVVGATGGLADVAKILEEMYLNGMDENTAKRILSSCDAMEIDDAFKRFRTNVPPP